MKASTQPATGFANTAFFSRTYDEALALLRDSHAYLSEYGTEDRAALAPEDGLCYSVETMRLTSRVTQIMAWLMAQRAVHEGELDREEVRHPNWRLSGHDVCLSEPPLGVDNLPPYLLRLMDRSEHLFRRVSRLDEMLSRDIN